MRPNKICTAKKFSFVFSPKYAVQILFYIKIVIITITAIIITVTVTVTVKITIIIISSSKYCGVLVKSKRRGFY